MLARIAAFEFRYQIKSPLFFATFAIFFLLAFGAISSDSIRIGGVGAVNVNAPHALAQTTLVFSLIAMFVITAFLATVIVRDFEWRTADLFRATPVRVRNLLLGRFAGAFAVALLLLGAVPLGTWFGTLMPWIDPERLGPFVFAHYAWPFLIFGVVNLFFLGALAFAIATLTRSMGMTYVAVIGFFFLYGLTGTLFTLEEHRALAALLDPFGSSAYGLLTRYWTPFELNSEMVPLTGMVLWNRLLWFGIASAILAVTIARFGFTPSARAARKRRRVAEETEPPATVPSPRTLPTPTVLVGGAMAWRQLARRTRFEIRRIVFGAPFLILAALALIMTLSSFPSLAQIFGTEIWPVTRMMIEVMQGSFTLSLMIVAVWVGAELVWRERDAGIHEVIDATPAPGWIFVGSKLLAALLAVAILLVIGILGAAGWQLWKGYTNFEWGLYFTRYFLDFGRLFFVLAATSVFVQTLLRNKFAGMGAMILLIISFFVLEPLGFEDPLYQLGSRADIGYSDMNGWADFAIISLSYGLYWAFFSLLLFAGAHLLWQRGALEPLGLRLRRVRTNLTPAIAGIGTIALAGFLGMGGYIVYNTRILNAFVTDDDRERQAVAYEERYMAHETLPQPRIAAIEADVDLYTGERRYAARGTYRLENRTGEPIETVHVGFNPEIEIRHVALEGLEAAEIDEDFNYVTFRLPEAMAPGAHATLRFETALAYRGFKHDGNAGGGGITLVDNGSLVYGNAIMPYIGFSRDYILTDRNDRRKYDLPKIDRFPDLEDMTAARDSYLRQDSDWIDFKTTVSTNIKEHVVAPGRPLREWTEGDRRYVTYEMSAPIQNLVAWLSADYERRKARWNTVDIEIFHDRAHPYNIDKMVETVDASLAYFSESFSPYQYEQMRVLEFPAFVGGFAQSFANTILWSEGLGFIARLEDPSEIDYVFYVGAHEMAHQWWGHQVSSANVQGQTVLVETLAQYSALMVMEREYGPHLMRRFLKLELDNYLNGRGAESREELPLYRVENQPYIHYRKGSVVMYALKDYLGEERINRALANLIDDTAYRDDPYPRSVDLLRHLEAVAETDGERKLIDDLFRRITLWDLALPEATVTEREDGRFDVEIAISARKLEADGEGREAEVPLDMPIDIGIFTENPEDADFGETAVLYLEKHRIRGGETTLTLTVDERPAFAGIDPYAKLVDRNTDDNLAAVGS